ncbi:DUF3551 domain-containing protein [Bradyrhizobium manausense]|uniref:DUF3551 domain-containing protein n=1 Tax=Bradyrhizobium TaxID=374 RepID=UPI001BA55F67|nr:MULTISPECIES: DUF3551 domain-containing protein [Bradyrhizobium]MBR0828503.1 DUF3551 domain-containing protein [Bradyrhizobium manausense]UVO25437.1 DUF3551 domain-containing protein [Bradyrhizobium arachidis]
MRALALTILTVSIALTAGHARAQTYDPAYPVCLAVVSFGTTPYYRCSFTTMAQCRASANGQSCVLNPYYAGAKGKGNNQRYRGQAGLGWPAPAETRSYAAPRPSARNRTSPCNQGREAYYGACQGYAPGEKEEFLRSVRRYM